MKLTKRATKALKFPTDEDFKPRKIISGKSSRRKMDLEFDADEQLQIVPFLGSSSFDLSYFESEGNINQFTPNPLFNDVHILTSYQKKAFLKLLYEIMVYHSIPFSEIRKRISDPIFQEKAYQYLRLLSSQNRSQTSKSQPIEPV